MDTTRTPFVALLVILIAGLFPPYAGAFVDPPTFSPPEPFAGQTFSFSVRSGVCHGFGPPPPGIGFEFIEIERDNELVDIIITGVVQTDPLNCFIPVFTTTAEFGSLPEGTYTVRIRIREMIFPFPILDPISESTLVVRGLNSTQVPTLSFFGLVIIAVSVLAIGARSLRSSVPRLVLFGAVASGIFGSGVVRAQEELPIILVEIAAVPGAPLPETIVEGYVFSGGLPPPLVGLEVEDTGRYVRCCSLRGSGRQR